MYVIANLETRAVLTYKDGARIVNANKDVATNLAAAAQQVCGHPHAVLSLFDPVMDCLSREVSPLH